MADVLSNWAANTALTDMLDGTCYLACHTADPTALGNPSTEVGGGGYKRQKITFTASSNRGRVSANAQTFADMPAVTVTHLAVWTDASGGHMVFAVALAPAMKIPASGQLLAAAGDVALSL